MQKDSSETKKDTTEYLKSHSKRSEIYPFSCSTTSNFLCQPTMVIDIFEDFEPPSKKFLGKSLCGLTKSYYQKLCKILFQVLVFTLSLKLGLIRIFTNFHSKYQNEKNVVLCRTFFGSNPLRFLNLTDFCNHSVSSTSHGFKKIYLWVFQKAEIVHM